MEEQDSEYIGRPNALDELSGLVHRGSRLAAVYLKELWSGGRWMHIDEDNAYRYSCYAALLGDLDSAMELYRRDLPVKDKFIEDAQRYLGRYDDRIEFHYAVECPRHIRLFGMRRKVWRRNAPERNVGYLDPEMFESRVEVYIGYENPYDIVERISPDTAKTIERREVPIPYEHEWTWVEGLDEWYSGGCKGDFAEFLDEESLEDEGFLRLIFQYAGYGTERNEEQALRGFLDLAEKGDASS